MKILKTRYDYIFLIYVPIALFGIILALFFAHALLHTMQHTMTVCTLLALILALSPYGKKHVLHTTPHSNKRRWLGLVLGLQITLYLAFYGFAQAIQLFLPNPVDSVDPHLITAQSTYFFWQGGFYPWPFYVVVAIALIYLAPTPNHPATIRVANRPILKKLTDGIIGYGIELFLKQGIMVTVAITLALNILQLYHLIRLPLHLPMLSSQYASTLLLSFLLLFLLRTPIAQHGVSYLYHKSHSPRAVLLGYCMLVLAIIFIFQCVAKATTFYFPAFTLPGLQINFGSTQRESIFTQWLLLNASWWIAWTPLVTRVLIKLAEGHRVREFIFLTLAFPFLLGLLGSLSEYYTHGAFLFSLGIFLSQWPVMLLFAFLSLIFTIKLFCDPEQEGFVEPPASHQKAQYHSRIAFMQSLFYLTTALLIIYLFSNITLIVLFTLGIMVPVYLSSIIACFGALRKRLGL